LAETAHGTFDMTRNPRPWIVYMILDQEGNRYPSFWCGGNVGGTIVFGGKLDDLDGTFGLNQTGSFTVSLLHTAGRPVCSEFSPPVTGWTASETAT
jgi:hypothetical protein